MKVILAVYILTYGVSGFFLSSCGKTSTTTPIIAIDPTVHPLPEEEVVPETKEEEFDSNSIFHIPSTGQSNSIGGGGETALSTIPYKDNLKMVSDNSNWEPLTEPATGHESRGNTETHASEMARTITDGLAWQVLASNSGEGGHAMRWIEKNGLGKSYAHSIDAVKESLRLAKELGRKLVVPAVVLIHGESDGLEGTENYDARLLKLYEDYDKDIRELTAQTQHIRLFITLPFYDMGETNRIRIHTAMKKAAFINSRIIVAGTDEEVEWQEGAKAHHTNIGYQQLGRLIGEAIVNYFKSVDL